MIKMSKITNLATDRTCNLPIIKLPDAGIPNGVNFFKGVVPLSQEPTCWETDIKVTEDIDADPIDVIVNDITKTKIDALMKNYPHMEWLAYLVGEEKEDGRYITDILIPEQEVTTVRVDVTGDVGVETIGVIHSHHDMGNSFSHTDDEFINQNNPLSLCVSHGGIKGVVRIDNGDGDFTLVDANVVLNDFGVDLDSFIEGVKENITVKTVHYGLGVDNNFFPGLNQPKILNLNGAILSYHDILISDHANNTIDIIELGHMVHIISQFLLDDVGDSYTNNIDAFYDDDRFEIFSVECLDVVDVIESIFSKNLTETELKSIDLLIRLMNTILTGLLNNEDNIVC